MKTPEQEVAEILPIEVDPASARRVLGEVPFWFHTFALNRAEGIYTPGVAIDHRYRLPFLPASFATLRVLDVGTFDGFYAFVAEARGAERVLAVDSEQHIEWVRARWGCELKGGEGFRAIAELLGSRVEYRRMEASGSASWRRRSTSSSAWGSSTASPIRSACCGSCVRAWPTPAAYWLRHTGYTQMMAARAFACIDRATSTPTTSSSIGALAPKRSAASPSWPASQGLSCHAAPTIDGHPESSRRSHTPPTNSALSSPGSDPSRIGARSAHASAARLIQFAV